MSHDLFVNLMNKKEPLVPELADHLCQTEHWKMLHHPLLISVPYHEQMNAVHNYQFRLKKEKAQQFLAEKNWERYVFLHERPYRVPALREAICLGLKTASPEFWELVSQIWIDTENVHQEYRTWLNIWQMPGSYTVMDDGERKALAALPDAVEIWRGVKCREAAQGLSWTTDKEKAEWFARRWLQSTEQPFLVSGFVARTDIKAYLLGRGESEVVCLPETVRSIKIRRLNRKKT